MRKRAFRLHLEQQKNGMNSLENRFFKATQFVLPSVYSIENNDAKNEYFFCSPIRLLFRDPRFQMICRNGGQALSFSPSFSALSLPRYTSSCASETVRLAWLSSYFCLGCCPRLQPRKRLPGKKRLPPGAKNTRRTFSNQTAGFPWLALNGYSPAPIRSAPRLTIESFLPVHPPTWPSFISKAKRLL